MRRIRRFLQQEYLAFQKLSPGGRQLLMSTSLAGIAAPLSSAFSGAYLWRHLHSIPALVLWNVFFFLFLCVGFGLNGVLMRYRSLVRTYLIGCMLMGAVPFLLILIHPTHLAGVSLLGALFGTGGGFYWGSRNLFTLRNTVEGDRLYYSGLEGVIGTILGIAVPLLTGSVFLFAEHLGVVAIEIVYALFAFIGFIFMCFSGLRMHDLHEKDHASKHLFVSHPSRRWNRLRLLEVFHGFHGGLETVIPQIMVLLLLGNEGALGFVSSFSACVAFISTYAMGRLATTKHRPQLLTIWIAFELLASAIFAIAYSSWSVLMYSAIVSIVGSFRWTALASIMFDAVEQESGHASEHYALVYDREIWLNVGRVAGLAALVGFYALSPYWTIRCALVGGMLLQLVTYRLGSELSKG